MELPILVVAVVEQVVALDLDLVVLEDRELL
jgi:hypothetical protein